MAVTHKSAPGTPPLLKNAAAAPVIYFDNVPVHGVLSGNIEIELAARMLMPKADGAVSVDVACVAHLRCSAAAARMLRASLDNALAMLEKQNGDAEDETSPLLKN